MDIEAWNNFEYADVNRTTFMTIGLKSIMELLKDEDGSEYLQHEEPLQSLIDHCEGSCAFGCCGYDSCDFSPILIAEFIYNKTIRVSGYRDDTFTFDNLVDTLTNQCKNLKIEYGSKGTLSNGYEHGDCCDSYFPGETIDKLSEDLLQNIEISVELINTSQKNRRTSDGYRHRDQIQRTL